MTYGAAVKNLLNGLGRAGIAPATAERMLPPWWREDSEKLDDAMLELKIRLARAFSLDVEALLKDDSVRFEVPASVRFKRASSTRDPAALNPFVAFACSVARAVVAGAENLPVQPTSISDAARLRAAVFAELPKLRWLNLPALLDLCWNLGIPVVNLSSIAFGRKGFDGLSVKLDGRSVIVLARNEKTPAWQLFIIAHELAHIALGHVNHDEVIVDEALSPELRSEVDAKDPEERAADDFAFRLLGGDDWDREGELAARLAPDRLVDRAVEMGSRTRTDPGHLILRTGYQYRNWPVARTALDYLQRELDKKEGTPYSAVEEINRTASEWLDLASVPDDVRELLNYVLGAK